MDLNLVMDIFSSLFGELDKYVLAEFGAKEVNKICRKYKDKLNLLDNKNNNIGHDIDFIYEFNNDFIINCFKSSVDNVELKISCFYVTYFKLKQGNDFCKELFEKNILKYIIDGLIKDYDNEEIQYIGFCIIAFLFIKDLESFRSKSSSQNLSKGIENIKRKCGDKCVESDLEKEIIISYFCDKISQTLFENAGLIVSLEKDSEVIIADKNEIINVPIYSSSKELIENFNIDDIDLESQEEIYKIICEQ